MKNPFFGLLRGALFAGVVAVVAASVYGDEESPKEFRADKAFFEKAAKSGMAEVAISTGALERLANPQVRDFAQTMVTDHSAVNTELAALAMRKGITLPPKDNDVAALSEKWSKKAKGVDVDYVKQMIDDHEDAVKLFQKAAKSDDAQVAAFAMKILPALQHHLELAKSLKSVVK